MDVGREGVDALDKFVALGATFGVVDEVGLALSSSVELSIDCIAASSAALHRQRSTSYLDLTQNSS